MAKPVVLEAVRIGFRNFEGREGAYNKQGDRNFVVFLDEALAKQMEDDGWNIKWPKPLQNPKDEEDDRNPYLPVEVSFKNIPPKVILVNADTPHRMDEDELVTLDWLEMDLVDLEIRPYHWSVNGQEGIKAYLKSIYIQIADPLREKYGV